jgi:hypothetical protein
MHSAGFCRDEGSIQTSYVEGLLVQQGRERPRPHQMEVLVEGLPAILTIVVGLTVLVILVALLLGAALAARAEARVAEEAVEAVLVEVAHLRHQVEGAEGRLLQVEQEIKIILDKGTSREQIQDTPAMGANRARGEPDDT